MPACRCSTSETTFPTSRVRAWSFTSTSATDASISECFRLKRRTLERMRGLLLCRLGRERRRCPVHTSTAAFRNQSPPLSPLLRKNATASVRGTGLSGPRIETPSPAAALSKSPLFATLPAMHLTISRLVCVAPAHAIASMLMARVSIAIGVSKAPASDWPTFLHTHTCAFSPSAFSRLNSTKVLISFLGSTQYRHRSRPSWDESSLRMRFLSFPL
mmetsp:Transcript_1634/g.4640  ORF Transcript_1634/g.4640 Transcript_1634/m.4640 type:complete len:216 (-) Transcript_1634:185-832(-)